MVDLEELKRMLEKALPAPWIAYSGPPINAQDKNPGRLFCTAPGGTVLAEDSPIQVDGRCTLYEAASWTNTFEGAQLIAALRNAAPALIEELEALREMAAATYSHRDGRDLLAEMRPHTWHFCDIRVRIAGQWKEYEGDWLKRVWMARSRVEAIRAKEGIAL